MKKFEVGKTYQCRSICDHNCIFSYEVIARTEKMITVRDDFDKVKRIKIIPKLSEYRNAESCYPEGKYSMCPIISADREIA